MTKGKLSIILKLLTEADDLYYNALEELKNNKELEHKKILEEALEKYEEILKSKSDFIPALMGKGKVLFCQYNSNGKQEVADNALTTFSQIVEISGNKVSEAHFYRSMLLSDAEETKAEGQKAMHEAFKLDPKKYLRTLFSTDVDVGKESKDTEIISQKFSLKVEVGIDPGELLTKGDKARHAKLDFKKAQKYYEMALEIDPSNLRAKLNLAKLRYQMATVEDGLNALKDAMSYIEELIIKQAEKPAAEDPLKSEVLFLKSLVLLSLENNKEASYYYEEAKDILRKEQGEHSDDGLHTKKQLAASYNLGGIADLNIPSEKSAYKEALNKFRKAVEFAPENPQYLVSLGNLYTQMDVFNKALISYEKAIELCPHHPGANNGLANYYKLTGDFKKAVELYDALVDNFPNDGDFWYNEVPPIG